jgi:hypothetical protein
VTIDWQEISVVCGALLALSAVLLLAAKGLSRLWQWRFGDEIKATMARIEAEQKRIEADRARAEQRLVASMDRVEEKLDQHLLWHDTPPGRPARPVQQGRPNGDPRTRR